MNIKELVPEKVESEINSPDHPTRRFVGFALLLAWHYNLWFLHDSFVGAQLLDDCVTQSWLIALVSAAVSFIVIAFALGRKHRLCNIPWMLWTATAAAVISTLALTLFAFSFPTDLIAYALAVVVGITNAILWIMWGELYSRTKTSFSVKEPQAFLPSHPPPHSVDLRTRFVGSNSPNACRSRFTRKIFRRSWLRLRVFQLCVRKASTI